MFKSYLTDLDLKGYAPAVLRYRWSDQTDFSKQRKDAILEVTQDLINRGFRPMMLRPDLVVRSATSSVTTNTTGTVSNEDTLSRMRWAWKISAITVAGANVVVLTLEGSNDKTTWSTVSSASVTAISNDSKTFIDEDTTAGAFKFYRMDITIQPGDNITVISWLTEIIFDRFIIYKCLEIILWDAMKDPNDEFATQAKLFLEKYNALWDTTKLEVDENLDGNAVEEESASSVRMGR